MKKFVCESTGEIFYMSGNEFFEQKETDYDRIKNMSKSDLINVLSWANEKTLREALHHIAYANKERLLRLAQMIHGRMYELIRSKFNNRA